MHKVIDSMLGIHAQGSGQPCLLSGLKMMRKRIVGVFVVYNALESHESKRKVHMSGQICQTHKTRLFGLG